MRPVSVGVRVVPGAVVALDVGAWVGAPVGLGLYVGIGGRLLVDVVVGDGVE